jgi:hypothetical protein
MRSLPKWTPRGLPDINLIYNGQYIGIEVKSPSKGLTLHQIRLGKRIIQSGGVYIMCSSVDELKHNLYYKVGIPL